MAPAAAECDNSSLETACLCPNSKALRTASSSFSKPCFDKECCTLSLNLAATPWSVAFDFKHFKT